jgi:undecaprenyl diphosphate synthase
VNYGGRWDITNAFKVLNKKISDNSINIEDINEALIGEFMCLSDLPEPDLFIRTGGEKRISNYLLWQLAYTELYFDDCLWPDFGTESMQKALEWYAGRERRFGRTSEQIEHA